MENEGRVPEDPPPEEAPRERLPHQRLFGALGRATGATAGLLPLWGYLVLLKRLPVWTLPVLFMWAFALFLLERRDAHLFGILGRLAAAAFLAGLATPATALWLETLGDPQQGFTSFVTRVGGSLPGQSLALGVGLTLSALMLLGLWLHIRSRSTGVRPAIAAGLVTAAIPILIATAFERRPDYGTLSLILLTGALVPIGVWNADQGVVRVDPAAPAPLPAPVRPLFASWVLAAAMLSIPFSVLVMRGQADEPHTEDVPSQLRSIEADQRVSREFNGRYSATLAELVFAPHTALTSKGSSDAWTRNGYVYRMVRGRGRWAAAADSLTGEQYYAIDGEGKIWAALEGPIPIDPETCEVPRGLVPVHR